MLQDLESLRQRIGARHFDRRMQRQAECARQRLGFGKLNISWQDTELPLALARRVFKLCGLHRLVRQNTLSYDISTTRLGFEHLPPEFDGFRILQISDLHIDGCLDGGTRLCQVLDQLEYDVCVVTGDYRFDVTGPYVQAMNRLRRVLESIRCEFGTFAILGNHDWIEMVPCIEDMGAQVLLNESAVIRRDEDELWIAGVDDNHYYQCADIGHALRRASPSAFKILLAHSPESMAEAADVGCDVYLAGHTHGGQICLPFGIPILRNARCARKYLAGAWKYENMLGYTSRGTGSSGIPVRLFCPPEITIHELVRTGQKVVRRAEEAVEATVSNSVS